MHYFQISCVDQKRVLAQGWEEYFELKGPWWVQSSEEAGGGGQLLSEQHLKTAPKMGAADHGGTWSPLSDPPCWQFNGDQQGLEQGLTASREPYKDSSRQTQHVVQRPACNLQGLKTFTKVNR